MPANSVYVGRPSKWGNPFFGPGAADAYRNWIATGWRTLVGAVLPNYLHAEHVKGWETRKQKDLVRDLHELRGKNLVCWCPLDQPCHADVLLELANRRKSK